jgi:hypothetical protein
MMDKLAFPGPMRSRLGEVINYVIDQYREGYGGDVTHLEVQIMLARQGGPISRGPSATMLKDWGWY